MQRSNVMNYLLTFCKNVINYSDTNVRFIFLFNFSFSFFQNINILKKVKKEYVLPGCISYAKMNNKNMKYNNEIFHLSCLSTSLHMHTPHSTNI